MEEKYSFGYRRYMAEDVLHVLPEDEQMLARAARAACDSSYSPYSGYRVGAAALLCSGDVLVASNQESEVFPAGICAERNLIANWQANHAHDPILAIAVASILGSGECYPCGICRQSMVDVERRQGAAFRIVMCGTDSATVVESADHLLPFSFRVCLKIIDTF